MKQRLPGHSGRNPPLLNEAVAKSSHDANKNPTPAKANWFNWPSQLLTPVELILQLF